MLEFCTMKKLIVILVPTTNINLAQFTRRNIKHIKQLINEDTSLCIGVIPLRTGELIEYDGSADAILVLTGKVSLISASS